MNRYLSIPAAWAFSPATILRAFPISTFRSIGIGLFYGQGYFRQRLDEKGWQQEDYMPTDVNQLPWKPAIERTASPLQSK